MISEFDGIVHQIDQDTLRGLLVRYPLVVGDLTLQPNRRDIQSIQRGIQCVLLWLGAGYLGCSHSALGEALSDPKVIPIALNSRMDAILDQDPKQTFTLF